MSHGWKKLFWWDTSLERKWDDKIHYDYVDFTDFSSYQLPANLKEIVSIWWAYKQSWKAQWETYQFTWVSNSWITYNTGLVNTVLYWNIVKWTCVVRYTVNETQETSSKYVIPAIIGILALFGVTNQEQVSKWLELASWVLQSYEKFINRE